MVQASEGKKRIIFFATRNQHKVEEARQATAGYGIEIMQIDAKGKEIQADSVEEIAQAAVIKASQRNDVPVIIEDAGLFLKVMNGFPGPFSSYVFKTIGNLGILKLLEGEEDRNAEFRSAVAFCEPGGQPVCFSGLTSGQISKRERGSRGFGFDPVFVPIEGDGRTFGEMTIEEKSKYSHRARALRSFACWYVENY